jgi:hypothetical protein
VPLPCGVFQFGVPRFSLFDNRFSEQADKVARGRSSHLVLPPWRERFELLVSPAAEGADAGQEHGGMAGHQERGGPLHRTGVPHLGLSCAEDGLLVPEADRDLPAEQIGLDDLPEVGRLSGDEEIGGLPVEELAALREAVSEGLDEPGRHGAVGGRPGPAGAASGVGRASPYLRLRCVRLPAGAFAGGRPCGCGQRRPCAPAAPQEAAVGGGAVPPGLGPRHRRRRAL